MLPVPRNLLVFLLLLFPFLIQSENTSFNFPSFTIRNLTLLGDSHLKNGIIGLTKETNVPSSSSGTLIYTLYSIETIDASLRDIDLKSGNLITSWIVYKKDLRVLKVYLSYSTVKPQTPMLSVDIDLSGYLKDYVFVGFSASTEGSTAIHSIENWSFKTYGFSPVRPRSHPHNVSDSSVTIISSTVPASNSTNKHHKRLGLGFGIAGPAFFFVVLVVFGYISVRKWKTK